MDAPEAPQIYLLTPPDFSLSAFPPVLAAALDRVEVACLRLSLSTRDEDAISRAADVCREVAHARDVPLVLDTHYRMVERLGLDGVHLPDGARSVRKVRKDLGSDPIVGVFCGASDHDGMTAGEAGADYVAFGPVRAGLTGDGRVADRSLFAWWSEMIELPVVAEGNLDADLVTALAPVTDFFAFGQEIWQTDDPAGTLAELAARAQ